MTPKVKKPKIVFEAEHDRTEDDTGTWLEEPEAAPVVAPVPKPAAKPRKPRAAKPKPPSPPEAAADPVDPKPVVPPEPAATPNVKPTGQWNDAQREANTADNHGLPYIRMLNHLGLVRPVDVDHVTDRLIDGYHFIVDEPSVPRVLGDSQVPDGRGTPGFVERPHLSGPKPSNNLQALEVWHRRMSEDRNRYPDHPELLWDYVDRVRRMIRKESEDTSSGNL